MRSENTNSSLLWVAPYYRGNLRVEGELYKNKWNTGIGRIFGKHVLRYFVLDIAACTFGYFSDYRCKGGNVFKFDVIKSIDDSALTSEHPVDPSLGFTVYTTTRPFYLYAQNTKKKAEFLYAFSCLTIFSIRPYHAFYESLYLDFFPEKAPKQLPPPKIEKPEKQIQQKEKSNDSLPVFECKPMVITQEEQKDPPLPEAEPVYEEVQAFHKPPLKRPYHNINRKAPPEQKESPIKVIEPIPDDPKRAQVKTVEEELWDIDLDSAKPEKTSTSPEYSQPAYEPPKPTIKPTLLNKSPVTEVPKQEPVLDFRLSKPSKAKMATENKAQDADEFEESW